MASERPNYVNPKPLDYSKWDELDFSSDEDDCHPNIEIGTWRRMKERMRKEKGIVKREPHLVDKWNTTTTNKKYHIDPSKPPKTSEEQHDKINDEKSNENDNSNTNSNGNMNIQNENEKENELQPKELTNGTSKQSPQTNGSSDHKHQSEKPNLDSVEQSSSSSSKKNNNNDDEAYAARSNPQTFLDDHLEKCRKFAGIKNDGKASKYLKKHPYLIHEANEGFLITHAVDRAVEGAEKAELYRLSRRCLMVHNLVQSCSQQNVKPEIGVLKFYRKLESKKEIADAYKKELKKQCEELLQKIEQRRVERLAEMEAQYEEEKAPVGPGGLDPTEVLNSLPKEMQEAFVNQDIPKLEQVLKAMNDADAQYYMNQCIDAGLWVQPVEDTVVDDDNDVNVDANGDDDETGDANVNNDDDNNNEDTNVDNNGDDTVNMNENNNTEVNNEIEQVD